MNESFPVQRSCFRSYGLALTLLAGTIVMLPHGSLHQPGNVPPFLLGAAIMLAGFYLALANKGGIPLLVIGGVAVAVRMLLLWQAPGDDIYRYIWEGKLLLAHINPYLHAPDSERLIPLRDALWELVEHRTFSAIYPPMAEAFFAMLAAVSPTVFFFKLAFALADLLTGWLLWRRYGGPASLLYLWNPLVIYSFAGGGHYDSLFILALVLGWLAWDAGRFNRALLWIGVAVALKWMALPVLGWAIWQTIWKRGAGAGALAGMIGVTPFLAFWLAVSLWTGEWTSQLYPPKFTEYARSTELVPRIVAWFSETSRYHNQWFLPPLALAWALVILRAKKFTMAAEWTLFFAMILSPLVHAWYFTWLMPFAVASRNRGSILLSASAFVYFIVYHRPSGQPEPGWTFTSLEIVLLWTPFVLGFLWTYLHPMTGKFGTSLAPEDAERPIPDRNT